MYYVSYILHFDHPKQQDWASRATNPPKTALIGFPATGYAMRDDDEAFFLYTDRRKGSILRPTIRLQPS
jgi:hypothetical protein